MKYVLSLLSFFIFSGCSPTTHEDVIKEKQARGAFVKSGELGNSYEVITIGPYTCVGMDGLYSGGIWCERIK